MPTKKIRVLKPTAPADAFSPQLREYLTNEISQLLGDTVTATWKRCLDDSNAFVDQSIRWPTFVSNCEVLETMFIPANLIEEKHWPQGIAKKKFNQKIFKTLDELVVRAEESIQTGAPLFPGDPYFNDNDKIAKDSKGLPYIEANAFLVSTILHFLLLEDRFQPTPPELSRQRLTGISKIAIDQILRHFISKQGWAHSPLGVERDIYFTWSVVETLAEVLECHERGLIDFLTADTQEILLAELSEVLSSMEDHLFPVQSDSRLPIFSPQVAQGQTRIFYNNMQAFICLGILGTDRSMDMAQALVSLVANSHLFAKQPHAIYPMKHQRFGSVTLEDRSIMPLTIRAIATVFGEYPDPKFHEITEKARLRSPWSYLVMADRLTELKTKRTQDKLWGPDGSQYEIYFTERVVEALTSCYYYVTDPNRPAHKLNLVSAPRRVEAFIRGLKDVESELTPRDKSDAKRT
jgi:hypothetical protein